MKNTAIASLCLLSLVSFSGAFASERLDSDDTVTTNKTTVTTTSNGKVSPNAVQISTVLEVIKTKGFPIVKEIILKDDGKFDVKVINAEGGSGNFVFDPKDNEIVNAKQNKPGITALDAAKKVEAAGFYNITEIKTQWMDDKYTVKTIDSEGNSVTVEVDALTGAVMK